jgi:quercetin dioxygenase-like cupin family protein
MAAQAPYGGAWTGNLDDMVEFARDGIVSKTIVDQGPTKVVLFSFAQGQSLSEHTASVPASIHVLHGRASILLGEETYEAGPGSYVHMPANLRHAVDAVENMVFLLTLHRGDQGSQQS